MKVSPDYLRLDQQPLLLNICCSPAEILLPRHRELLTCWL